MAEKLNQNIVIFDFCETLVNFQTADAYVDFVRRKLNSKKMNFLEFFLTILIKTRIIMIFYKLFPYQSIEKRIKLYQLKGLKKHRLIELAEQFYNENIRPNLILLILDKLKDCQEKSKQILIVSGGYSIYLDFFCREFNVPQLISTKIEFKNNICTGKILGLDCLYHNKINLLADNGIVDGQGIVCYTDSVTDLPLLDFCQRGIVVSKNHEQKWAIELGFEQLIWSE